MTPELVSSIIAAVTTVVALLLRRARCFARRHDGQWEVSAAFSEAKNCASDTIMCAEGKEDAGETE